MIIQNLIEDTPGAEGCLFEHGLSFYIETEHHKMLIDAGASRKFMENADKLGVDLAKVDIVFLSHGHYDHGGGILPFCERNSDAKIYLRESALERYYSEREDGLHYAGLNKRVGELPQLFFVQKDMEIDKELFIFTNVTGRRHWPHGNIKLKRKEGNKLIQDEFEHEQYLILKCEDKEILMSGCAHNGILNVLDRYIEIRGREPDYVISGFHMMKHSGYSEKEAAVIKETANELKKYKTKFFTGHCTGESAFEIMREILGEQIVYVRSGERVLV